jgi:hypothetical protein
MPQPSATATKSKIRRVSIPGELAAATRARWKQFRYPGFSPFALELICFDLRLRVPHEVTARLAQESERVQGAIDRALARYHHSDADRDGLLIQAARGEWSTPKRAVATGDLTKFRGLIRYSETLAPCIEQRWPEAGYESLSHYVTAILRYDLLLLGRHHLFSGDDKDPVILESLDRETRREFEANVQPKRIYLDRLLEKVAGRPLTQEELRARKLDLAERIIEHALRLDRESRSRA